MKCCVMEGGVVLYNRCVFMCSVSSLWGSELVIGTVWVGSAVPEMVRFLAVLLWGGGEGI
jgi:hypothetical protein